MTLPNFYNLASILFPKIPFCESYFFFLKTDCFVLVFNDSSFSYSVAVRHQPPTAILCSTKLELFQL